jgi:integrase
MNVEQRRPTTVDRRLAALRNFFTWARASELLEEPPTDSVQGVGSSSQSPRSLEKPQVGKLIRAVERPGNKRDLAIVLNLRHTGIRVSEFCSVTLSDIELSERKGSVIVRSGKGSKYRVLPLNVDARRAIADYLRVRPTVETACLFVGQRQPGSDPMGFYCSLPSTPAWQGWRGSPLLRPERLAEDEVTLVARRVIPAGAELTADYLLWEADEEKVMRRECRCRSPLCRGRITGWD